MALNKFMHPRNIYKNPPDFSKLLNTYPNFSKIAVIDVTGKVTIDFKDPSSLRILTKCLLKSDFNLDVEIPENRLVPTLPLRLNYILWIEDILNAIKKDTPVHGLDIGTGACAIYPLLAAVMNKWHMLGTETDDTSLFNANHNVQKNNLEDYIKLVKNSSNTVIKHLFIDDELKFDFCMCNPPFYCNIQELYESRSPARPPPKNGFTGSPQELITEGGELEFCRKLIKESKEHKSKIIVFTTMIGHKYNLKELLKDLQEENITFTHTEFCQGRVTRWGLAWTFSNFDILSLVPPRDKPRKKNTPIVFHVPELPNQVYDLKTVTAKLIKLLNALIIKNEILNKRENNIIFDIKAFSNTWSNQRRKRRLEKRLADDEVKRLRQVESDQTDGINSGPSNDSDIKSEAKFINTKNTIQESDNSHDNPIVHAFIKIYKRESDIFIAMEYLSGISGKEGLHQIFQYVKNNWK